MTQDKTLLVIDGSHLAYKCYFAVLQFKRKRFSRPGITQTPEIDYLAAGDMPYARRTRPEATRALQAHERGDHLRRQPRH